PMVLPQGGRVGSCRIFIYKNKNKDQNKDKD
ncbi:hypothetical protein EZS27_008599, partial [termite gut metagenome]